MNKIFTLFVCMSVALSTTNANTVEITVTSNQFSPANTNVLIGDIVSFKFSSGFHNATSLSVSIPAGAAAINSGDPASSVRTYNYTVTQAGVYNYYCQVHSNDGTTGMIGSFTASEPLPVTLKEFLVTAGNNKTPVISWRTLTEQNVNYFSLRSSVDGKAFSEIAKITAKGNSNTEQLYSFNDTKVSTKHRYVYYELVTVDRDGKQSYSPIKIFKTAFASKLLVMQLGPNPISRPGQLMVQFNAEKAGTMTVNVFDASGKKQLSTRLSAFPGLNNGHVHVCDFIAGIYTLQFAYEGITETRKIVVN